MPNTTETTIEFLTYKCAADRIRRGMPLPDDERICDAWEAQGETGVRVASLYDLPVAAACWRGDGQDLRRG